MESAAKKWQALEFENRLEFAKRRVK